MIRPSDVELFYEGKVRLDVLHDRYPLISFVQFLDALGVPSPHLAIAARASMWPWDRRYAVAITQARADYDNGVAEIITSKFVDHFILYRIPRVKRFPYHRRYFSTFTE